MRIDRWVRLGVVSLAMAGNAVAVAEVQRWRPSAEGLTAGMPMAPMPPAMLPGFSDPRFRPVPRGNFLRPPPPPAPIYPGRLFVSVQGQSVPSSAGAPAFAKQYAWRPADRPMEIAPRHQDSGVHQYPVAAQTYPGVAQPHFGSPYPMVPGGHYVSTYGHPAPMGMLPPPPYPLPYPGLPFGGPGVFPPAPQLGAPGFNLTGYPSHGMWPSHPYVGRPPMMGHPSYSSPWIASWRGVVPPWSRQQNGYANLRSETPAVGGFESAYPLAGLY